jgi:hypothetical protein
MRFHRMRQCKREEVSSADSRAVSGTVSFSDDFESGSLNKWSVSRGTWSVVTDGSKVLNQASTSEARIASTAPLYTDGSVEARVKVTNFNGSNRVYVTGRHKDFNNYYAASLYNSSGGKIEIRKKVSGSSSTLASKSYALSTNVWYTVRLETQGHKYPPLCEQCYYSLAPAMQV